MVEQTLSSQPENVGRLPGYWKFVVVCAALLCAELLFAFRWGARGDPVVYWLFILDNNPYWFCVFACLIALAAIVLLLRADLNGLIRAALIVAYVLPLPVAFLGGNFRIAPTHPASSMAFQGHVYYLGYVELSSPYYVLYECDGIGFECQRVDTFGAPAGIDPGDAALTANANSGILYVVRDRMTLREYTVAGGSPPVGRWPAAPQGNSLSR